MRVVHRRTLRLLDDRPRTEGDRSPALTRRIYQIRPRRNRKTGRRCRAGDSGPRCGLSERPDKSRRPSPAGPPSPSSVARSARLVDVQVDSAFVASADDSGAFIHRYQRTKSGRMIVFQLPGGKTLHVQPRAIDGGMIAMEVVLFDGARPTMTANLKLQSGDTFALTGQQSQRRHAAPADQPDQGGQRIYQSEISLTARVTCRPRPCPPRRSRMRRRR